MTRNSYVAFYKISKKSNRWQRAPKKLKRPTIAKPKNSHCKSKQHHNKPTNTKSNPSKRCYNINKNHKSFTNRDNKCNNNHTFTSIKRINSTNPNKNTNCATIHTSKKTNCDQPNKPSSNKHNQRAIKLAFSNHKCNCHESNAGYFWTLKRKLPTDSKYTNNINKNMKVFLSIISKQFHTCKIIPEIKISCKNTEILIHACNSKSKHLIWQSCMIFIDLKKNKVLPKSELWIYQRYNLKDDKTLCFKNLNNCKSAHVILYGVLKHEIHDVILPFSESLDCSLVNTITYYKHKNLDKYAIVWSSNKQPKLHAFVKGLIKDYKLNSEARLTPITIQMLELEYDKINNTYDNSANIVKIPTKSSACELMQLLKDELHSVSDSIDVHRHRF